MNGTELSEAVRETRPDLSILLFSREETEDVATEIVEAGLTDYLRKGMGTEQYTMLVRRVGHAVESGGSFDRRGDTSLDAVGVVGPDDHFERIDERYASVYGYDTDALEGRHWTALHPEEEVEHIRSNVLPVVEDGGKWSGRSVGKRNDGTTFTESKMVTALDDERLLIAVSDVESRTR
ncbi:MAG: PAS domain-containing protein, partial [Halobaculum sp.]